MIMANLWPFFLKMILTLLDTEMSAMYQVNARIL